MALFLSRFDNKLDRKGRVSVPASFRAVLAADQFQGIVAYPSPVDRAIEACGMDRIEQLSSGIERGYNPFSRERIRASAALLARSSQLQFDAEGRVMLPQKFIEFAGLTDTVTFAGMGQTFQMWNPDAYDAFEKEATADMQEQAPLLQLFDQLSGGGA